MILVNFEALWNTGNKSTSYNRPYQKRAQNCVTSYPLRSLIYLGYENVNHAMVNRMMLRSSMHALSCSNRPQMNLTMRNREGLNGEQENRGISAVINVKITDCWNIHGTIRHVDCSWQYRYTNDT